MNKTNETSSEQLVRRTRQNAVVLFLLFLLQPIALCILIVDHLADSDFWAEGCRYVRSFGLIGAVYAVFFLAVRWRTIRALPRVYRLAAVVGGAGLILMSILTLLWR